VREGKRRKRRKRRERRRFITEGANGV